MSTERQVMQGGAAAGQYARCGPGRMRNKPGEMHKKGARMLRNFALAVLSAAALTVAMAAPALAQGPNQSNSITVTAPVSESITMSGQASFSFPATVPGGSQTVTAAEAYTVSTNDLLGYTLNLNTGSSQMAAIPATATPIPNTALSVTETATAPQTLHFTATGGGVTVNKTSAPTTGSGDAYSENWTLSVPAGTLAGNYTEGFTYVALAN